MATACTMGSSESDQAILSRTWLSGNPSLPHIRGMCDHRFIIASTVCPVQQGTAHKRIKLIDLIMPDPRRPALYHLVQGGLENTPSENLHIKLKQREIRLAYPEMNALSSHKASVGDS